MESKFKSLTIFEFQEKFKSDNDCLKYLSEIKWASGFSCKKCGHKNYCQGNGLYTRQCTSCNYNESATCGTLFHKLKFSLLKAFYIVYYVSTNKKGITSTELSRKLGLRQKTCWLFKQKVMRAMKSSGNYLMTGNVEVDETVIGGQEENTRGRKNNKKKLVVFAIEKKGRGVSRVYGKVIEKSSAKEFTSFFEQNISVEAEIKTDQWRGYSPLKKDYKNLKQKESGKKGKNFPELHRVIMGFKGWLRGMHHHASHLQAYIDEYTYRFNRNFMKENIFDNLLNRMMSNEPCSYKMIIN
jgi:hypothetical protein